MNSLFWLARMSQVFRTVWPCRKSNIIAEVAVFQQSQSWPIYWCTLDNACCMYLSSCNVFYGGNPTDAGSYYSLTTCIAFGVWIVKACCQSLRNNFICCHIEEVFFQCCIVFFGKLYWVNNSIISYLQKILNSDLCIFLTWRNEHLIRICKFFLLILLTVSSY